MNLESNCQNHLLKQLRLEEFTAIDLETTGLDPETSEIIELGCIRFKYGVPADRFSRLVRPEGTLPKRVSEITGIEEDDLVGAPSLAEALPEMLDFLRSNLLNSSPLVAHNVEFERSFLRSNLLKEGTKRLSLNGAKRFDLSEYTWFDTLLLSRIFFPSLHNHKLGTLAEHLFKLDEVQPTAPPELRASHSLTARSAAKRLHRAEGDAERAGLIFLEILKKTLSVDIAAIRTLALLSPPDLRALFLKIEDCRLGLNLTERTATGPVTVRLREARCSKKEIEPLQPQGEGLNCARCNLQRLDQDEMERIFRGDSTSKGGVIWEQMNSFKERPQQVAMALEVAQAFNESSFLVAEAGTGTGKSFAYLVPAIYWAKGKGKKGRVIISTNTKNLQDQLFHKDIPFLARALGQSFKAALLKGRSNYICLHKWRSLLSELEEMLSFEGVEYMPLAVWLTETETGDISENNGFWSALHSASHNLIARSATKCPRSAAKRTGSQEPWSRFGDDPDYCMGRKCELYEQCYSIKARREASSADIVVINHALLLSDLELDRGILGKYDYLIIDEAHNLEEVATEQMTSRLSLWDISGTVGELYLLKGTRIMGILSQLGERIKGRKLKEPEKNLFSKEIEEAAELSKGLRWMSMEFFGKLTEILREERGVREDDYPLEHAERGRYNRETIEALSGEIEDLQSHLITLTSKVERIEELLEEFDEEAVVGQKALLNRVKTAKIKLKKLTELLQLMTAPKERDYVHWYEIPRELGRFATLYATPLDVPERLYKGLYHGLKAVAFTSATLSVGGEFEYFKHQIGLDLLPQERLRCISFGHPFDYHKSAKACVPQFLPSPKDESFYQELSRLLLELERVIGRRTMVLFTSYKLLNQVYNEIREAAEEENILLRAQGVDGSRSSIMEAFKRSPTPKAMLLGTDSFWEGVDLPGESLEVLVLTRLPFPVPSDPLVEARSEKIVEEGGDPFYSYALPKAVIGLKQGFGRLIRSDEDRGAVIIADNRIVRRRYGECFLSSLPVRPTTYYTPSGLLVELERFFSGGDDL